MSSKLKKLLLNWAPEAVISRKWLLREGFTSSNIQKYHSGGWIKSVGSGAYIRASDSLTLGGVLYGLQLDSPHLFYLGGKTSLEYLGSIHNISASQNKIILYANRHKKPPSWFFHCAEILNTQIVVQQNHCKDEDLCMTNISIDGFNITVSGRERAALEMCDETGLIYSFQDVCYIFENLSTLRPSLIQSLLESYSSIKAKRIFLLMGKRLVHSWFQDIDLSRVDLGVGPRQLAPNGIYDSDLKITYPKGLFHDDDFETL